MKKDTVFLCFWQIFLGTTNLVTATALKGNIRSIARVIMHPQYDSKTTNNDIALIKLASPILTFTDTLMPACLPTGPITARAVQTGTKGRRICYTAGWGRLSEKQRTILLICGCPVMLTHHKKQAIVFSLNLKKKIPRSNSICRIRRKNWRRHGLVTTDSHRDVLYSWL